jgi:hypothetical protein
MSTWETRRFLFHEACSTNYEIIRANLLKTPTKNFLPTMFGQ